MARKSVVSDQLSLAFEAPGDPVEDPPSQATSDRPTATLEARPKRRRKTPRKRTPERGPLPDPWAGREIPEPAAGILRSLQESAGPGWEIVRGSLGTHDLRKGTQHLRLWPDGFLLDQTVGPHERCVISPEEGIRRVQT